MSWIRFEGCEHVKHGKGLSIESQGDIYLKNTSRKNKFVFLFRQEERKNPVVILIQAGIMRDGDICESSNCKAIHHNFVTDTQFQIWFAGMIACRLHQTHILFGFELFTSSHHSDVPTTRFWKGYKAHTTGAQREDMMCWYWWQKQLS